MDVEYRNHTQNSRTDSQTITKGQWLTWNEKKEIYQKMKTKLNIKDLIELYQFSKSTIKSDNDRRWIKKQWQIQ